MNKKTIRDINLRGKRGLMRVDYNVALENGRVADDLRISQTIPTIEYLLRQNCQLFLVSHLGRPEGKKMKKFSLLVVAKSLEKLLKRKVNFIENYIDREVKTKEPINLLENVRFYPGEEENDPGFSRKLAALGEVFVNDAFGVCHRAQSSTVGVTKFLSAVAGLLLEKEVDVITQAMNKPQRPLVVIIGGAKTETKIGAMRKLAEKADKMLVGGAVGNTFMAAAGEIMGKSLVDKDMIEAAKKLIKTGKILLPVDGVWEEEKILDVGPKTLKAFGEVIAKAKTIIWNGPMGMFEKPKFTNGTDFIYQAIKKNRQALSIVGGGETLAALNKNKDYVKTFTHVSTGGGAMLELIEKGSLPGIDALMDK